MTKLERLQTKVKRLRSLEAKHRMGVLIRLDERYNLESLGLSLEHNTGTNEGVDAGFKRLGSLVQKFIVAEKELHEHLVTELRKAETALLEHDNEHS